MQPDFFDQDYYERGLQTRKSCYVNYRWIPELTIPLAMAMIDYLQLDRTCRILDYGCAKGYIVKALRLLHRDAWGVDVSQYAIDNVDPSVKDYCALKIGHFCKLSEHRSIQFPKKFDICISKDVFEHIPEKELGNILENYIDAKEMFVIVPLGSDGKYFAELNNDDPSHIICEDEIWWTTFFQVHGWKISDFTLRIPGIKDSYSETCNNSHGFFTLEKM